MMARCGRRTRHGVRYADLLRLIDQPHVYGYKVTRLILPQGFSTLGRAMMFMRTGRYLIVKTGHAIGCIDGVLHDTAPSGPSSRVRMVFKFELTSAIETREQAKYAWADGKLEVIAHTCH